jgi:hypothetical protein
MAKRKQADKTVKKALDTFSPKRPRGRPPKVCASAIQGRADNYRAVLDNVWDRLSPLLLRAQTEDDVIKAFQDQGQPYDREFIPLAPLVLKVLQDKDFPKRRTPQINFFSDSSAGLDLVTPRRSRDVCREEREKTKRAHHIIRYEFHVECSCGYTGHSRDHACPQCGAGIPLERDLLGWG